MANGKRKGHINGSKFCKHGTVTESARKVAETVNKFPEVETISNGIISGKGPAHFSIKFDAIHGGWKITVRGSHAVQKLYVYTSNTEETRKRLEEAFSKNLR